MNVYHLALRRTAYFGVSMWAHILTGKVNLKVYLQTYTVVPLWPCDIVSVCQLKNPALKS